MSISIHIGELWPCCVLGYDKPLGNLRNADYEFNKIWHSQQARSVREYIKDGNCHCPLANQAYSNILMNVKTIIKVFTNVIRYGSFDYTEKSPF
jgi:hypothetical protein